MLVIHRAERADTLVAALGALLAVPYGDPFAAETVAVPSRGVERWLAQQLSGILGAADGDGVCANVLFPPYGELLDDTLVAADAAYAAAVEAWHPDHARWPLLRVLDRVVGTDPAFAVLAQHLGPAPGQDDAGRRLVVAGKLAHLFERYGRSRPELITGWQAGHDDVPDDLAWQPRLWRLLRTELGTPAPAELLDAAAANLADGPRLSIFGATRIAPGRVRALHAIAARRDVHLWLHHPSPALWAAVAGERPGPRRTQRPVAANPLLASLSRDVRELQQLLDEVAHRDEHLPAAARPATLLGRLQRDLADDRVGDGTGTVDASVQVHAAHGPARQVEIVREVILGLLADDPTLEPRDVVIMCPDVESFAPLIAAGFGMIEQPGGHPAAALRVRLADRSPRRTNPLLGLLAQLLDLASARVTATQLLDLANTEPVRRRFGLDDDDLERLRAWAVAAGARWGLDATHRGAYGLGALGQNTWRSAVDRLLLGVAMEEGGNWLGDTLPLDDVDSADIDLAGRFAELLDRLGAAVDRMTARHAVHEWVQVLDDAVAGLGEGTAAWQQLQLRRELHHVLETAGPDADTPLGLADVAAVLTERLAGRPTRSSFRTGTLTVCTLVPMRSVPHRVVCLIGLDDSAFPRRGIADGDDVLAHDPRSGERDARSEDRQLFLDAICAAQEHLVITYTGADPRTGAEVPPCVPLGELLDAVEAIATAPDGRTAREHVVVRHPLQPFDARNFSPGELGRAGPFSFDTAALDGARAAVRERTPVPPLVPAPLPAPPPAPVTVDDLVRFFQHPARGFLRQRLDVATFTDDDDPADALTVELDGLQGWAIGERVLRRCLAGTPRATAARQEFLRGELPPGVLGERQWTAVRDRVEVLLQACDAERRRPGRSVDVRVELDGGRAVVGTVAGLRGSTILAVTYSRLAPKHRLAAWIRYLSALAATGATDLEAVTIGRDRDGFARTTLAGVSTDLAHRCLDLLVRIREAGLRAPLPLPLAAAAAYAERRGRNVSTGNALTAAEHEWSTDRFAPERAEPEHVLVYGPDAPFEVVTAAAPEAGEEFPGETSRFAALARSVWGPLQSVERYR